MSHAQTTRAPVRLGLALAAGLLVAGLAPRPTWAAPVRPSSSSLALVPADAAFYSAGLRYGEQMQIFLNSKAWARLRDLPAIQNGWQAFRTQYDAEGGPFAMVRQAIEQPENRELLALLQDAVSE